MDQHMEGLVQDCSISIANALEILQSCIKPSMYGLKMQEMITYTWYDDFKEMKCSG